MTSRVRREPDAIVGMRGVEADCVDEWQGGEDVLLIEELVNVAVYARGAGVSILDPDGVLHHPFVDCFCGVSHVDFAGEVGFAEDVGEGGGVIHVEAI